MVTIFVIIQTNFIGMQSIMTDITDRVDSQRVQKRLAHRFYHLINVIDTISDKLMKLDIENNEFKILTGQLDKLSSFDYLEKIYVNNIGADIDKYRDFQLNPNLQSIVEQLKFLYNKEIVYKPSEYFIEIRDIYDIYFYEGLYLLIENLILKSDNSCSCTIHSYKKNGTIYIEIFFSNPINTEIKSFINSLKREILKGGSINKKHLNLKMFLDKLPQNIILELVISTYFNRITIDEKAKNILFKL